MARAAIYVDYPQAVPLKFTIDKDRCLGCGICEGECPAGAIAYDQVETLRTLDVGSVILSPASTSSTPRRRGVRLRPVRQRGHVHRVRAHAERHGPYRGTVMRPSTAASPPRSPSSSASAPATSTSASTTARPSAACTPSRRPSSRRSTPLASARTSSSWTSRLRQGVRRLRHAGPGGAPRGHHARQPRGRHHRGPQHQGPGHPWIKGGDINAETFNLVVLSVGLHAPKTAKDLAKSFASTSTTTPSPRRPRSRPRDLGARRLRLGAFSGPRTSHDRRRGLGRGRQGRGRGPRRARHAALRGRAPARARRRRRGSQGRVFVCHCGINIGGVVNVPDVSEYAKTLPNVAYAENNLYTCSQDTQERIKDKIKQYNLNRVVVASCTPRTHEPCSRTRRARAGSTSTCSRWPTSATSAPGYTCTSPRPRPRRPRTS